MKAIIFLIMLFALPKMVESQPKNDSLELKENLKLLDKTLSDVKVLDKKLEKKELSFYNKMITFFTHYKKEVPKKVEPKEEKIKPNSSSILKPNSEPEYCEEIYTETVKRDFFGRLFNKSKYKVRKYKYENNEKVYLD